MDDTGQSGLDSPLLKALLQSQQTQYQPNSGGMGVIAQMLQAFMSQKMGQKTGDVTKMLPSGTPQLGEY